MRAVISCSFVLQSMQRNVDISRFLCNLVFSHDSLENSLRGKLRGQN